MGPVKQDSSIPPKMITLPVVSLDDGEKKNRRVCHAASEKVA